jgi:hypothetical protein
VARHGKWTDGLVPFGYTLDEDGCLTPSERVVAALGMTEADAVRDLFLRMAAGSSALAEARRLNALGVPTTRYYGNGTKREGKRWYPGDIAWMLNNPTYRGVHVRQSRYGQVEHEVPTLMDTPLWERANAQIQKNWHLPRSHATPIYYADSSPVGNVEAPMRGRATIVGTASGDTIIAVADAILTITRGRNRVAPGWSMPRGLKASSGTTTARLSSTLVRPSPKHNAAYVIACTRQPLWTRHADTICRPWRKKPRNANAL